MKIGIIGLGLMGGSLAKKLRLCEKVEKIIAYDINVDDLKLAKKENIISEYTTEIDSSFSDLDYIIICTPVRTIVEIAKKLELYVSQNCLVMDIGSTKSAVVKDLENMDFNYIGTHPMVGKETSGFKASDSHLYEKAKFIITPTSKVPKEQIEKALEIIRILEAEPVFMNDNEHDGAVSAISHVPHVVAFSLVNTVKSLDNDDNILKTIAAGGFKDITRIASSDPIMWQNIFLENSEEVLKTINEFKTSLNTLEQYIRDADKEKIEEYIFSAKEYRDSIDNLKKNNEIDIKISNTPGELERIVSILAKNNINIINLSIQDDIDEKNGTLKLFFNNMDMKEQAEKILNP